jgi:hypothetical protein
MYARGSRKSERVSPRSLLITLLSRLIHAVFDDKMRKLPDWTRYLLNAILYC